jgi:hypothetical protein
MLEPDARAGAPVDPESLVAMKKSFDIVQHVNIHEDIPGLLRVLMRHASGRRVARARACAWCSPDNRRLIDTYLLASSSTAGPMCA